MTSMVPLRLTSFYDKNIIIWNNNRPSSTRYCRAIQFQYTKETTEKIKSEKQRMDDEIAQLRETEIEKFGITFKINHQMIFTMIDGKIAQAITDTPSSSSCFICGSKPSQMNNLAEISKRSNKEEALKLGMSPLHARIKFMECILHIAYNLSFKKWSTTPETRIQKEETKRKIQETFYNKLGLRIDIVKQGSGSSNNGNTSRRFFADPKITAEITGVDEELIRRFATILQTINCGEEINSEKFGSYAYKTAKIFIEKYSWYFMPITVHKVLLHGKEIIKHAALPIGTLSEEAQEARNKDYKQYRLNHSRKCSRLFTNEDVMHMMLVSSDPLITSLRRTPHKKDLELSDETQELLCSYK